MVQVTNWLQDNWVFVTVVVTSVVGTVVGTKWFTKWADSSRTSPTAARQLATHWYQKAKTDAAANPAVNDPPSDANFTPGDLTEYNPSLRTGGPGELAGAILAGVSFCTGVVAIVCFAYGLTVDDIQDRLTKTEGQKIVAETKAKDEADAATKAKDNALAEEKKRVEAEAATKKAEEKVSLVAKDLAKLKVEAFDVTNKDWTPEQYLEFTKAGVKVLKKAPAPFRLVISDKEGNQWRTLTTTGMYTMDYLQFPSALGEIQVYFSLHGASKSDAADSTVKNVKMK